MVREIESAADRLWKEKLIDEYISLPDAIRFTLAVAGVLLVLIVATGSL